MPAVDDKVLTIVRRDVSEGVNTRQQGANIRENQVTVLYNVDIGTPGETDKRPGISLVEDLSNDAGIGLFGFQPAGGTNQLVALHGQKLETWPGSGSFTERKTDFVNGTPTAMLKVGESGENDVLVVKVDGNNWYRMNQSFSFQDLGSTSGTGTDSPPDSSVGVYYRNRLWILKDNNLYYSSAFPADYSGAFDTTTDYYLIPVGEEKALLGIRDQGIVCLGKDEIWGLNPSATPAATDKAEKLLDFGCIASKTAIQVGDDIFFLSHDGVRGLFRSQQDKLQTGTSYPLSYPLEDEYDAISWAYIEKAVAVFWDNKYFLSLPVDGSTTNNQVWVYWPSNPGWMVITGWNISDFAVMEVDGEERLYGIDSTDGSVYRVWTGYDDDGTAINYQEEGRKEDFGQPLITKSGGELKITAFSSGDYDIDVYGSADDQEYVLLGSLNLAGNAPTLPISLPFDLAGSNLIEGTFHLEQLGPFKQFRYKLQHNDTNGSDKVTVYERTMVTYPDEYQSE